jgi:hypothetical protein
MQVIPISLTLKEIVLAELAFLLLPTTLPLNLNEPIPAIQVESGWVTDAPPTLSEPESPLDATEEDADIENILINKTGQNIAYLGVFLLAICVVAVIGILSRRVVWAVIFALILTAVLITFMWFV